MKRFAQVSIATGDVGRIPSDLLFPRTGANGKSATVTANSGNGFFRLDVVPASAGTGHPLNAGGVVPLTCEEDLKQFSIFATVAMVIAITVEA